MTTHFSSTAAFIWSVADLLRGDFKQSQYGRIILPFTLLRRLEAVLEASKDSVLAEYEKVQKLNLPEEAQAKLLLRARNRSPTTSTRQPPQTRLRKFAIPEHWPRLCQFIK